MYPVSFIIKIEIVYENKLLGTAGTIWHNMPFFSCEDFIVINSDNLSQISLQEMFDYHQKKGKLATLGYYKVENPKECGIIAMDGESVVIDFSEKPGKPKSRTAYAGIAILNHGIFKELPFVEFKYNDYEGLDLGFDVFPRLIGKMAGYKVNCFHMDVGTEESYLKAIELWSEK